MTTPILGGILPTPTGAPITNIAQFTSTTNQNEGYYQNLFTAQYGAAAGNAYAQYNKTHNATPYGNAKAYLEIILVQGLDTAIKTGTTGAATALGKIPGAVAQGAQNAIYGTGLCNDVPMGDKILSGVLELIAVGGMAVIAGFGKRGGQLALIFMIGFWVIWLVADAGTVQGIGNFIAKYTGNAA